MALTVAQTPEARHIPLSEKSEKSARTAKTDLRKPEKANPQWVKHGQAMREVMRFADLSLEEFAHALKKNDRQIARQMLGQERPQIEAVLAVERFEGPMVIALARRTSGVDVDTVVHIRRSAK